MSQEAKFLEHDHAELGKLLAEFFTAFSNNEAQRSLAKLDCFWARLAVHIRAEHLHLFPTLLRAFEESPQTIPLQAGLSLPEVRRTISHLQEDHDYFMRELAAAVRQLRELSALARQDKSHILKLEEQVREVSRRLEAHNHLEESQVYQWLGRGLDGSEQKSLSQAIERELENAPARFRHKQTSDEERPCT